MKKNKFLLIVLLILILSLIFLLPFIINFLYKLEAFCDFFAIGQGKNRSGYEPSDILNYYSVVISFVTTTGLAVLTIIQTKRINKKAQEIDELKMKWLQKELSMAVTKYGDEQNHASDKDHKDSSSNIKVPKFEIQILGYSGNYANIKLKITNVSNVFVSSLTGVDFKLLNNNGEIIKYTDGKPIPKVTKLEFEKHYLNHSETTIINTNTPNLRVEGNIWNSSQPKVLQENAKMTFHFSCEDEYSNKFFFEASIDIPNTKVYNGTPWECNRIA